MPNLGLSTSELLLASWAISNATGNAVPSEEVTSRVRGILELAVANGSLTSKEQEHTLTRLLHGVPPEESTALPVAPAVVLIQRWLQEESRSKDVILLWFSCAKPEDDENHAEDSMKRIAGQVTNLLVAELSGIPTYAVDPEPEQKLIVQGTSEALSEAGYCVQSHDLSEVSLSAIRDIVPRDRPVNVVIIPPLGSFQGASVESATLAYVQDSLGVSASEREIAFCLPELIPALLVRELHTGSRALWFGYQSEEYASGERSELRRVCRESLVQYGEWIELAHFWFDAAPPLAGLLVLWGGHSLHTVRVGPAQCRLRIAEIRSWVDWFTRVQPSWFSTGVLAPVAAGSEFLPLSLTEEDAVLPWTYELMGPAGYAFRKEFLPYGKWITLNSIGSFRSAFLEDDDDIGAYLAEDEDDEREWIPIVSSLEEARNWSVPDADGVWMEVKSRSEWDYALLREGDLLFDYWNPEKEDLRDAFVVVGRDLAGALAPFEDSGLSSFVFGKSTEEVIREWVTQFLGSPAGDGWARIQGYDENQESHRWEHFLVPLPSSELLDAYERTDETISRLRQTAQRLQQDRKEIFDGGPTIPRWERLRNLGIRSGAISLLLTNAPPEELPIRLSYPYPISAGLRALRSKLEADERLEVGLKLAENTTALLLAYWLILETAQCDGIPSKITNAYRNLLAKGLTFGKQLGILGQTIGTRYPDSAMATVLPPPAFRECLNSLTLPHELRNRRAHLLGPGQEDLSAAVAELDQQLMRALGALEPIAALQLLIVESADNDPITNRCSSYRARLLAGDHPDGWLVDSPAPLSHPVFPGAFYLRTPAGSLRAVNPFLRLRRRRSGPPEIGVMNRIRERDVEYRSLIEPDSWTETAALEQVHRVLLTSA